MSRPLKNFQIGIDAVKTAIVRNPDDFLRSVEQIFSVGFFIVILIVAVLVFVFVNGVDLLEQLDEDDGRVEPVEKRSFMKKRPKSLARV